MRKITSNKIEPLTILAADEPGVGGASHRYEISGYDPSTNPSATDLPPRTVIVFQNGPIKEKGANGITTEALLAIVADRLTSFQSGPLHHPATAVARTKLAEAMEKLDEVMQWLEYRDQQRQEHEIAGTHEAPVLTQPKRPEAHDIEVAYRESTPETPSR